MNDLFDRIGETPLVWDGAMGTQIQACDPEIGDFCVPANGSAAVEEARYRLGDKPLDGCNEILNLTRPDIIESIHLQYLDAGSDLIETNTFGSTSIVLAEYQIPGLVYDISLAAAQIARKAADSRSTTQKPRFVVGAIGPGTKLVSLGQTTWHELQDTYRDSFLGLLEGGADALMLETLQDLLMIKATIVGAKMAMAEAGKRVPLIVQVTMEQTGTMLLGSEIEAALATIEAFPEVVAFGMNCATGPVEMVPHLRTLSKYCTRPLSVQPNAGLPQMEGGKAVYKLTPEELAKHHEGFIERFGVAMVGGCCGTTPSHLAAVADMASNTRSVEPAHCHSVRKVFPGLDFRAHGPEQDAAFKLQGTASLFQFQPHQQDASILIVGEKTNANGSRAFRENLNSENWEALVEIARELEAEGSHLLDICTAYVGRDEARDMGIFLELVNKQITVPIVIDSTEIEVIEVALQKLAGKPIVNSINFEDGEKRARQVLELCKKYGAAVVALTIDEEGMAKSAERKVQVAHRLLELCREYGIPQHDVFIDCLTFTLGSGEEDGRKTAIETLDAIEQIRAAFPRVNLILGVSNVSFGLNPAARQVLNSAMLSYARERGLNSAIVHFSKILPENQIDPETWKIASDLIFDRREYASA